MKIVCLGIRPEERNAFEQLLPEAELYEETSVGALPARAKEAVVLCLFVNSQIGREELALLPQLKFIATRSTGTDHIDLAAAKEKGITVANVPGYGRRAVAEFAFALLLTLSRRIFEAYHQVRFEGDYSFKHLRGFDLGGKTIGLIGTGQIGKHMARLARGFEMEVLAYDRQPDEAAASEIGFSYAGFDDLLARSDIISLHIPYLPETKELLNEETLAKTKKGVYIINTARGELIDTTALIAALRRGQVAGAGLDVLEAEKNLQEEVELIAGGEKMKDIQTVLEGHILIDMPQVVVTPHIAFYSAEAEREIVETSIRNIKAFTAGAPVNIIV